MEVYPEIYIKIYQYLFYKTCPNPDLNPFFNMPDVDKEELIMIQLGNLFSTEDDGIPEALALCQKLYETPTSRAYDGIKAMLDRLGKYMKDTSITNGRDGNGMFLLKAAKEFNEIRESYKGVFKDLMEEQDSRVRGGAGLAYDDQG